jgi:hypothetical protein
MTMILIGAFAALAAVTDTASTATPATSASAASQRKRTLIFTSSFSATTVGIL